MSLSTHVPESSRIDAAGKVDARIDYILSKHLNEHSNFSFRSCSPDTNLEKGCHHYKTVVQGTYDTCFHCGVYVSKNGIKSYKSEKMNYFAFFPSKTIYETLTKRSHQFRQSVNQEYSRLRQAYVEWILELAEKLRISFNSTHLAVLLLDIVMFKEPSLTPKIQLYAPICLLIAAKTIELDERIPYLPKLKKYANSSYSIDEFRKAELHVFDLIDWNAQFSSALEITEFLLCQGALFSSDEIEEDSSPINRAKRSPEALSENTQHENTTTHFENKFDQKKNSDKELEKNLSPNLKENNENSYSDASTVGTHNDSLSIPYLPSGQAASDDVFQSPTRCVPLFLKHNSTPATIGSRFSANKGGKLNERRITEILNNFETSYIKLATTLLKDVEFIQFEPKVVSAAILAFLRYVNKLVQIWNFELEAITGLQFSQVSPCFEIIYKKYTSSFKVQTPKYSNILNTIDSNRNLISDLKLTPGNGSVSDKSGDVYSTNKINLVTENYFRPLNPDPLGKYDLNRAFEKKTIFGQQGKSVGPTSHVSSTYLYDNASSRPKYMNGPLTTDFPQRSLSRNTIFPTNYQASKFNEYSGSYHNSSQTISVGSTRVDSGSGSYSTYGSYNDLPSENYYRIDQYSQLNSRTTSALENGSRSKFH